MKTSYGVKSYIFMDALSLTDWSAIVGVTQSTFASSGTVTNLFVPQKIACRNYKNTLVIKNVCTYQLKFRVTTAVCRRDLATSGSLGPDFESFYYAGFDPPYVNTPSGETALNASNINCSPYQNPLFLHYFKIIKQKSYTLMPYRSTTETLHVLRKRPGLYVNNVTDAQANYFARTGGWSSCVKIIEVVGEMVTNDGAYPAQTMWNSPGVFLIQDKSSFESAAAQSASAIFGVGDAAPGGPPNTLLTGQPWNYMYPTPSATASAGTSSIVGALTAGV